MFAHSHHFAITGGNFTVNVGNLAFEKLQKASAPSAFHNSSVRFDPPKCHPNTRVAVLEYLMGWIFGRNDPDALILWLYGPAGAGKSAIQQTLAERCFERNMLLASFFFGRSDPTRNTFKPLVATIAYQIASAFPQIKPYIESVIERDPLIFDKSIATQLQFLIIDPLKNLAASGFFNSLPTWARLVLIDGLDECDDPRMQSMILRVLANALRDQKLPLIFLIASRPEQHITLTFNSPPLAGLWRSLVLDDLFHPYDDIHLYLTDKFLEIKTTHPHHRHIPEAWPEPSDIGKLVEKSSGQFIYASVVAKYVSAQDGLPPHQLEVVKGLRPVRGGVPFAELDALYLHLLGSCKDRDIVVFILGAMTSKLRLPWEVNTLRLILDLEPGEVEIALAPLNSILHFFPRPSSLYPFCREDISLYHASFGDFLGDISRSATFYIDPFTVAETLISKSLQSLGNLNVRPPSVTMYTRPAGWDFFVYSRLSWIIGVALPEFTLTDTVKRALKEFSLPQLWTSCPRPASSLEALTHQHRVRIINHLLQSFWSNVNIPSENGAFVPTVGVADPEYPENFNIYTYHLSSFESVIKSEVAKYYHDKGLRSLVVITMLDSFPTLANYRIFSYSAYRQIFRILLQITEESMNFDDNILCLAQNPREGSRLLVFFYHYLFTGPNKSEELFLDGDKYAQTALSVLEFLCADLPPISYQKLIRKRKTPKHDPGRSRTPTRSSHHSQSREIQTSPRKRRQEKHRHGVGLSKFRIRGDMYDPLRDACDLGLKILPEILGYSVKLPELVNFVQRHGKDIAVLPNQTRKAVRAMHEYLDRPDEHGREVPLRWQLHGT